MNDIDKITLSLIRIAISGNEEKLIKTVNWSDVKDFAIEQGVLGLIFNALDCLSQEQKPERKIILEWIGNLTFHEQMYKKHRSVIKKLASFYNKHDIKFMVLKGYGLSLCWPKPNHRPVGDIDSYNYGKHTLADKLIKDATGINIDNSHHKHSVFSIYGVTIENHFSFLNAHSHKSTKEIENILEDEVSMHPYDNPDNEINNLYYPSVKFNSLYLLRHSAEHFASVDLKLRQILDWAFFVKANKDQLDWNWLISTLDKVGMKKYLAVLNAICIKYLGFDDSLFPQLEVDDKLVERCINDILHPEVKSYHAGNLFKEILFRFKRWQANKWKHDMVFKECMLQSLITQIWGHIIKPTLQ